MSNRSNVVDGDDRPAALAVALIEVIWPRLDSGRWKKDDVMAAVHNVLDAWEPRE